MADETQISGALQTDTAQAPVSPAPGRPASGVTPPVPPAGAFIPQGSPVFTPQGLASGTTAACSDSCAQAALSATAAAPATGNASAAAGAAAPESQPAGKAPVAEEKVGGVLTVVLMINLVLCLLMLASPLYPVLCAAFVAAFFLSLFLDAGSHRCTPAGCSHIRLQATSVFIFLSMFMLYALGGISWLIHESGFKVIMKLIMNLSFPSTPDTLLAVFMPLPGFQETIVAVPLLVLLGLWWPLSRLLRSAAGLVVRKAPVRLFSVRGLLLSIAALAVTALVYGRITYDIYQLARG